MSRTKSLGLRGRELWVYDASLSLVLAEVIRGVDALPEAQRPQWWPAAERELRVQAVISDFHFDLELGLSDAQRAELAELLDAAADRVRARGAFTAREASAWNILDGHTVIFRGREPVDTASAADLAQAIARLIRGTLPEPPPGTWWYYGSPGGPHTIRMQAGPP